MRLTLEVLLWRGPIAESRHRLQAVLTDADGRRESGSDSSELATTFRSAAKPFQLLPLVERGHAERWQLSDEQLALMASSHTGSRYHVEGVAAILDRLKLRPEHLACGYHEPLDPESLAFVRSHPAPQSPLYNNCSGKHAGMLCLALSEGWPVEGYERAEHPVQQLMRRTIAEVCEVAPETMTQAVDGCSAQVFGLPLSGMSRAYARMAGARREGGDRERALARIREAMAAFPRAVGGEGRLSTALMEATSGRLTAKGGAEGLECLALTARRQGLAVKCEDGAGRALGPAVVALLEHLGELSPEEIARLEAWRHPVVKNVVGLEVGTLEAVLKVPSGTVS